MVGLGFGKQGGSKTKGGIPLFFFAPPLAGGCEKKSGVRKERGVHAPRAPPLSTLLWVANNTNSKEFFDFYEQKQRKFKRNKC